MLGLLVDPLKSTIPSRNLHYELIEITGNCDRQSFVDVLIKKLRMIAILFLNVEIELVDRDESKDLFLCRRFVAKLLMNFAI
jgi:hypothetical protein